MRDITKRQKLALELVNRIIELKPDKATVAYALMMRSRLKLPIATVMESFMPGSTIAEKIKTLGITRPTYYSWMYGRFRPDDKLAKKLAKHTGFNAEDIRGQQQLWNK